MSVNVTVKTIQEFALFVSDYSRIEAVRDACKKLFTQESLNDHVRYKRLIEELKETPVENMCYCTKQILENIVDILDKYMILEYWDIVELRQFIESQNFESC